MDEPTLPARIVELENDNRRLRRLLNDTNVTTELRHRLNSTLALLRTVIRNSTRSAHSVEMYAAHVEDRMNTIARAQATADITGEVELGTLIADELRQFGASEGERSTLSGPDVFLQPRAGQVFALATHELAINALEHGALATKAGHIDVAWGVTKSESRSTLKITWKETGAENIAAATSDGFGTEVLKRLLSYEFGATTLCDYEPDGLRCVISFDLTERIGRTSEHQG